MEMLYIDIENVGQKYAENIPKQKDRLLFLFGKSLENNERRQSHLIETKNTLSNSADFILISKLTENIIKNKNIEHVIVTRDNALIQGFIEVCNNHEAKHRIYKIEQQSKNKKPTFYETAIAIKSELIKLKAPEHIFKQYGNIAMAVLQGANENSHLKLAQSIGLNAENFR